MVVSSIGVTAANTTGVLRALPTSKAASTAKHAIVSHTVLIMVQSGRPMGLPEAPERFGRLEGKPNLGCGHGRGIIRQILAGSPRVSRRHLAIPAPRASTPE